MISRSIHLAEDIRPVSEFMANAAETLKHVRESGRPLVLPQNGRSAAVLLDVAAYQALVDENELLRDLRAAAEDIREGRLTPHEQGRSALLSRYAR